ncbi:dUTP pyrophosphatase [Sporothrix brasiliensis 5110]|uniref:Deoxyuridine 5'-triphosphate nucleotidohydrolase n=1 Tax=Sporothrix brasiliensis 5110 TaxID=1398154 RepID=A0A0C2IBT2_9PEZI|nr:dUTP pyrophosphatase [Sporothrix brasiliensis 5110]KIH86731.1 dUTP pyrophosphatase [Sporothrix brasiliensis 5110]
MTTDAPVAAAPSSPVVPLLANSPPTSPPAKRVKTDSMAQQTEQPQSLAAALAPAPVPALAIQKLSADAKLPTRGSAFAAGYDLYAARACVIPARGKALVDTDIAMAVPAGTYGRIAPRSGLAAKHFIDTGAGVIDADYRGHVRVLLFNHNETDFAVAAGDRVAQLVLERIVTPDVVEVAQLDESVRGAGGFGSTGGFGAGAPTATAPAAAALAAAPVPAPTEGSA